MLQSDLLLDFSSSCKRRFDECCASLRSHLGPIEGECSYPSVLTLIRETYRKTYKEENPDAKGIAAVRCLPVPVPLSSASCIRSHFSPCKGTCAALSIPALKTKFVTYVAPSLHANTSCSYIRLGRQVVRSGSKWQTRSVLCSWYCLNVYNSAISSRSTLELHRCLKHQCSCAYVLGVMGDVLVFIFIHPCEIWAVVHLSKSFTTWAHAGKSPVYQRSYSQKGYVRNSEEEIRPKGLQGWM